jgi:hypothetical protein
VKCQAMENTYSKNSSIIPGKFNIYRSCIKSSIEVLKSIKFGLKIIHIYLTSIINFNYSIPFSIFYNTTKRKEIMLFAINYNYWNMCLPSHMICYLCIYVCLLPKSYITRGCHDRNRMVVEFTTTYAISAYHWYCEFESWSGRGVQHCDKVCQGLATGRWFSPGPMISSTNKTDRHDITEILLKVSVSGVKHHKTKPNLYSYSGFYTKYITIQIIQFIYLKIKFKNTFEPCYFGFG